MKRKNDKTLAIQWSPRIAQLSDLKEWDKNPRKIDTEEYERLVRDIKKYGFHDVLKIDSDGTILSGHQRKRALLDIGVGVVSVLFPDRKLTEQEREVVAITSNRHRGVFDFDILGNEFEVENLLEAGFTETELTGAGLDLFPEDEGEDDIPEAPVEPISVLGDLYELGAHRVLCGDSTNATDVERLMGGVLADLVVTDPPYNTGMEGKPGDEKAWLSHMFNDSFTDTEWASFLKDVFSLYFAYTKGDCAFYTFIDWRRVNDIRSEMEKHMDVKNVIVWDKKVHGLGSDYKSTYELCVVGKKGKPDIHNRFGLDYQDIWRLQREMGRNKSHATAKPVELLEKPIIHASKTDDIVLDLFLGSGSTVIAAEKTRRACYGMELDPKYVDVIISRWVKFTGNSKIKKNGVEIEWKTD